MKIGDEEDLDWDSPDISWVLELLGQQILLVSDGLTLRATFVEFIRNLQMNFFLKCKTKYSLFDYKYKFDPNCYMYVV